MEKSGRSQFLVKVFISIYGCQAGMYIIGDVHACTCRCPHKQTCQPLFCCAPIYFVPPHFPKFLFKSQNSDVCAAQRCDCASTCIVSTNLQLYFPWHIFSSSSRHSCYIVCKKPPVDHSVIFYCVFSMSKQKRDPFVLDGGKKKLVNQKLPHIVRSAISKNRAHCTVCSLVLNFAWWDRQSSTSHNLGI